MMFGIYIDGIVAKESACQYRRLYIVPVFTFVVGQPHHAVGTLQRGIGQPLLDRAAYPRTRGRGEGEPELPLPPISSHIPSPPWPPVGINFR